MRIALAFTFVLVALVALNGVQAQSETNETQLILKKLGRYGSYSQTQINNARDILQACAPYTKDLRQLAYIISTAIGESNLTPIKEYRGSPGTYHYDVQNAYWYTGYYGRGYVQLTWDYNYRKFGGLLGIDLLGNPDLALNPSIAGKIICIGMTKGLFTGVGLNDYFDSSKADWTNARRIVNGLDKAAEFGNRASAIYTTSIS